jgi:hypothetical protein
MQSARRDGIRSQPHPAAGLHRVNCRPQALNRAVHGLVIAMLESPEALITPYGCRWNNPERRVSVRA